MQEKWLSEAWFATLESKERIKGRGKTGGDSPKQALQTESATWNACKLRRIPTGGKNWRGSRGLATERKREKKKKKKETAAGPED